ncbi:LamG domain-containing protein [Epilithonimonas pallida]|uniref:Concanavalin A-like lectin/glucanases superfamily protein n=1 Tax=Epilithonimonas pallida TaxID=373671 RepID=A0ABY1R6R7_9FLAO|nr:LamG domain-containing protein [Epilithonimonas pallida]SMP94958.1 Concanavalin A-like lectin/glucanases superfamily protein [Epilithonimonas pallida]
MKNIIKLTFAAFALLTISTACSDGYIDDITEVAPGEDKTAPTSSIVSPSSDLAFPATSTSNDFTFNFKVTDDIEIGKVVISLDGNVVNTYTNFLDYRIFNGSYFYKGLSLGTHIFKVDATDLTGKTATSSFTFNVTKYSPVLTSETVYVPFNSGNDFKDLINLTQATVTGAPTTTPGKKGTAYKGVADAYISYPISGLFGSNNKELSLSFWYKTDASQERAGMVVVGNPTAYATGFDNSRKYGFRLFKEQNTGLKINVGIGNGEFWGDLVKLPTGGDWVFVTVTIDSTTVKFYYNGTVVYTGTLPSPIDFSGCSMMDVASGGATFGDWEHKSDTGLYDEFKVYNKALTTDEVIKEMQ